MKQRGFAMTLSCLSLGIVLIAGSCPAAENIYPDPSFEGSGVAGVARTGDKAGYLKVDAKNHWASIGGPLAVEPFARYRVTEWVKANIGKGNFYGPYVYDWNNYVWAFADSNVIKTTKEWTKVQLTFVSPNNVMNVHPLAYIDCENSEAWVDDIVVEKIAEPKEVIAEIEVNANRDTNATQILARWYVKHGEIDKATALMKAADGLTRSDIACLLAQNTPSIEARRPLVVEMIAYGGPTYNYGIRRLNEITTGMSRQDRIALYEEAVLANPSSASPAKGYGKLLDNYMRSPDMPLTIQRAGTDLASLRASLEKLYARVPDNSAAKKGLQAVMRQADDAQKALEQRRASMGKCVVKIGGKQVTAATHAILIPTDPTPQEQHAARDLQVQLELATGEALPVWYETDADQCTPIVVGKCKVITNLGADIDFEGLGLEGIDIKTVGLALILAGNKRGVLYATYTFLEDYLGFRWFAPDCSKWPTEGAIEVPQIDRRYIPPLEYRATDYPSSRPGDFAVRNKYNGTGHQLDEARGGKISYKGFVHTFNSLVPPSKYFATHPEYYSEINGNRIGPDRTQLCLTNPDVLKIAGETVRRWIKESPGATIISVSQNDYHNYCQCDKCKALAEKEGSQAGPLLHFVNAIADDIKDDYPDKIIDTLAYQYTRKPPKFVKPRPNVAVRLCSIECCFIHPLATDEYNKKFVDDIKGWSKICRRLYIWDYVINYAHSIMPFPNLYVLKPNINFFVNNGVTGIYEEACYYTKGSEMQELRTYVMAKLLWDPSYDTDKAIDEFCAAYWGPAGRYVREYINVIQASAQSIPNMHVRIYSPPSVGYLTPEVIAKSVALFDQAEEAVKDDATLLHRVQVARLPIMYTQIALGTPAAFTEEDGKLVQGKGDDTTSLAARFEKIARAEGVTRVREGGPLRTLDAWLDSLPKQAKDVTLETLDNGALKVTLIPQMGGRIWRMQLPDGRDLLKMYGEEGAWTPDAGGYEEYSETGYRSPGWSENYTVTAKTAESVTMVAQLKNGLEVTRKVTLAREGARDISIETTLKNRASATKTAAIRVHPEFAVADTAKAKVSLQQAGGVTNWIDLANPADPKAEKERWFRGAEMPLGQWSVADAARKLYITNRFKPAQVDQLLLNWNGADKRVNLELFGKPTELKPGESVTLEHSYEIQVRKDGTVGF